MPSKHIPYTTDVDLAAHANLAANGTTLDHQLRSSGPWTPVRLQIVYVTDAENGLQSNWEYSVRLVDSVGVQVDAVLSQRHRSQRLMGEGLKGLRH